ncbi:MAG: TetR family transcriptional regulator [Betaproteobacteria bacterium]|nr:TetR family transcriptional regulator [Betaproteobacteria bacterium]
MKTTTRKTTTSSPRRSTSARKTTRPAAGARPTVRTRTAQPDRRGALLDAAFDLFAERNFASVSIKDIGAAVGANTALIYYYFGSKEELFRAAIENAVDRAFDRFRSLHEEHSSPPEIIAGWLDNHVVLQDVIRRLVKISLDYAGTGTRIAAVDRIIRRFYDEEAAVMTEAIREGVRAGLFRKVAADRLVAFMSTHLDGVMVRSAIFDDVNVRLAVAELRSVVFERLGYPG